jgi:uncharacterized protein (DUF2147 family)
MKKMILLSGIFISLSVALFSQAAKINGYWLTQEGTSQVHLYQGNDGKYSGKIVWLKEPYENGDIKRDKDNPNASLRKTPLLDLVILKNFEYDSGSKEWKNGTIYDPKNGKTYDCYMWFNPGKDNELQIKGFVLGMRFLGRESTWTRENAKRQ